MLKAISIKRGSPRQHIWTFIASSTNETNTKTYYCPCNTGSSINTQSFVGDDYFCESAANGSNTGSDDKFFIGDPLWDGEDCNGQEGPCCSVDGLPWFHKVLDSATSDYIELRVCGDQDNVDEDTPVSMYEIYIK